MCAYVLRCRVLEQTLQPRKGSDPLNYTTTGKGWMLISNGTRRRLVEIPTHPQFGLQTALAAQTDGKKDRASSTDTAAAANK